MATKRKASVKKTEVSPAEPTKPQFVTEVVEDVPEEALETIKEKAEEIEGVVEEIKEKKEEEQPDRGETMPVGDVKSLEQKKKAEKDVLAEIFTKESIPKVYPDITAHKPNGAAPVFLWAVIIIGVALLTGGTLLVIASGLPKLPALFAKPTPPAKQDLAPQGTPTPTPAAAARSDLKLQVLNGGGTPGSAGKAKSFLEEKGYTVADVDNTDEYTFQETEIHVKAGKESHLELLKTDLADEYTVGTADAALADDSPYDAQVIVGKK